MKETASSSRWRLRKQVADSQKEAVVVQLKRLGIIFPLNLTHGIGLGLDKGSVYVAIVLQR